MTRFLKPVPVLSAGLLIAAAVSLALVLGCGGRDGCKDGECDDCERRGPRPHSLNLTERGPRPHSLNLTERDAGRTAVVHCGDVVRVHLPCRGGHCFRLAGGGVPHLCLEHDEGDGTFRFRCAAPGSCSLRFSGGHDVSFHFHVRP